MTTIALDPGFGSVKLCGAEGSLVMQSAVSFGDGEAVSRMAGLRSAKRPVRVTTEAGTFHVGEGAHDWGRPVENLDFDRLTGSPEMMALFLGALTQYGVPTGPIDLIVGLPIHTLIGEEAATTRRGVRRMLQGTHTWVGDEAEHTLTVEGVQVTSQPVGAMFDYLLDDAGHMLVARKEDFKQELGVLGIGMNTLDLLVVRNGQPVQRYVAGEKVGVRRLLDLAGDRKHYSLAELDQRLRWGTLPIGGALPIWASEVSGFIERQWDEAFRRFRAVVAVGGGAVLLHDLLAARFKDCLWMPDDPIIATARGLFKFALMQERRTHG